MIRKILAVGIVFLMLATAAVSASTVFVNTKKVYNLKNVKMNSVIKPIISTKGEHLLSTRAIKVDKPWRRGAKPADIPVANTTDNEFHPSVAVSSPFYIVGYTYSPSIVERDIYLMVSKDDGKTFEEPHYINIEGIQDYPSLAHWGGNTFYGSFMPDPDNPYVYLIKIPDITDVSGTGEWVYYDWSSYGWHDFQEPDIACCDTQNDWEFGVIAFVASTEYEGYPCVNGPHMLFADPTEQGEQGYAYISWWTTYNGSAHASASIDRVTNMMYCAYDWYNDSSATYDIILWKRSFEDPLEGFSEILEIPTSFYAMYPSVVADNDHVVIVCQSDEHINQDIICLYSSDGGETWNQTYVTSASEDDLYPNLVISGDKIVCTFIRNGDIYYTSSEDWGETWKEPIVINDVTGAVSSEWRSSDACENGVVWTDSRDGNNDIYFDNYPGIPMFDITISGGFGITITVTNIGSASVENIEWSVSISGLVFIGKESSGSIDVLAPGESITVKLLPIGIGSIDISVSINGATKIASGFIIGPIVII